MKRACEIIDDYGNIFQIMEDCEEGGYGSPWWYSTWQKYLQDGGMAVYYSDMRKELQDIYQNDKEYSDNETMKRYMHAMSLVLDKLGERIKFSYCYEDLPKAVKTAARFIFWNEARGEEPQAMADMITHKEAKKVWNEYNFTIEKLYNETGVTFTAWELLEK